ncbi:MAG: hypothetical protein Q4D33_14175 [Prevotellaceae bacterium]|nr:hypothetical protein [Prevotellaceae bacterium]
MAKKNNGVYRTKGSQMYRRPTKAMQQQYLRNNQDYKLPETPSRKRIIIQNIIVGVVVIGITTFLSIKFHWAFSFLGVLAILAYLIFVVRYMNGKQKELFQKYAEMGMTKKQLIKQMQLKTMDQKQIDSAIKAWDAANAPEHYKRSFLDKVMGM